MARGCSVSCSKLIVVLDRVVCLPNIRLQMRVQRYFLSVVSTFRMRAFSIVISIRMRCREFLMVSVDSESTCRPAVRGPCPCLRKNEWCPVNCDLLHSYCVPSASCYCCPLALCPCVFSRLASLCLQKPRLSRRLRIYGVVSCSGKYKLLR